MGAPSLTYNGKDFSSYTPAQQQAIQSLDAKGASAQPGGNPALGLAARSGNPLAVGAAAADQGKLDDEAAITGIKGDPLDAKNKSVAPPAPDLTDQLVRANQYAMDSRKITSGRQGSFLGGGAPSPLANTSSLTTPALGKTLLGQ